MDGDIEFRCVWESGEKDALEMWPLLLMGSIVAASLLFHLAYGETIGR